MLVYITGASAQKISLTPAGDFVSRYIWRGLNAGGASPAIQPSLELSAGNFTLGTWGSMAWNSSFEIRETDLYVKYDIRKLFSVTVTDYFLSDESQPKNHFFEFDENKTAHVMEASASFNGTDKIPFSFLAAVNFWGADARDVHQDKQYSTYLELGYNGKCNDTEYNIFIGGTPTSPDQEAGETGYYGNCEGITNLGIKAIKNIPITEKFALPVSTSFIINPQTGNVFLVFGVSI